MSLVFPSSHPLALDKLATLRDRRTGTAEFRRIVRSLATHLAQEATRDLATREVEVTTPLGPCASRVLADKVMIVPILRPGLGMAEGMLDLIPEAEVWHVGLFRDEETLRPTEYYNKLPHSLPGPLALVVDPMLATGGSAVRTCEILKAAGRDPDQDARADRRPGGDRSDSATAMPDVPIHVGAIDERLNEVGFIYPGLGDAGDRQFATVESDPDRGRRIGSRSDSQATGARRRCEPST